MLDRLVAFGALFDWITPIATWLQDMAEEPSVGYNISVHAGWSALVIQYQYRMQNDKQVVFELVLLGLAV